MPSHITQQTARAGFNLIEAAVVLGVIGLIIGGIWVAAAAVSRANSDRVAIGAVLSWHAQLTESLNRLPPANGTNITTFTARVSTLPGGWQRVGSTINTDFGTVRIFYRNIAGVDLLDFSFVMSQDRCQSLMRKMLASVDRFLYSIQIDGIPNDYGIFTYDWSNVNGSNNPCTDPDGDADPVGFYLSFAPLR